ncbi:protein new-glue 2 [Drosophila santomea]|uniref:protein new-glue 2 n=1 Tax=Drosophila santomea TaxID=129105 RepID=UPI00195498BA|nr:protein new-glue 2 [Drosophila santomea]
MPIFAEKFRQLSWPHIKPPASQMAFIQATASGSNSMKAGQLALRILAISLCIWLTSASTTTSTTTTTTDATATTTTTTDATTTTTTTAASSSSSSSKVHHKRIRIKDLRYSISRKVRVNRKGNSSSSSRSRKRSGRRVSSRQINRLLLRRNQG